MGPISVVLITLLADLSVAMVARAYQLSGVEATNLVLLTTILGAIFTVISLLTPFERWGDIWGTWLKEEVNNYLAARSIRSPLFQSTLDEMLADHRDRLAQYARGKITVRLEPLRPFQKDFALARKYVLATSYVDPPVDWDTPAGLAFFDDNVLAVQKGVKIGRIFIEPTASVACLSAIVQKHVANGIAVGIAYYEELDHSLREDFMIIDGEIVGRFKLDGRREVGYDIGLLGNDPGVRNDIRRAEDQFLQIANKARNPCEIPQLGIDAQRSARCKELFAELRTLARRNHTNNY